MVGVTFFCLRDGRRACVGRWLREGSGFTAESTGDLVNVNSSLRIAVVGLVTGGGVRVIVNCTRSVGDWTGVVVLRSFGGGVRVRLKRSWAVSFGPSFSRRELSSLPRASSTGVSARTWAARVSSRCVTAGLIGS